MPSGLFLNIITGETFADAKSDNSISRFLQMASGNKFIPVDNRIFWKVGELEKAKYPVGIFCHVCVKTVIVDSSRWLQTDNIQELVDTILRCVAFGAEGFYRA